MQKKLQIIRFQSFCASQTFIACSTLNVIGTRGYHLWINQLACQAAKTHAHQPDQLVKHLLDLSQANIVHMNVVNLATIMHRIVKIIWGLKNCNITLTISNELLWIEIFICVFFIEFDVRNYSPTIFILSCPLEAV